MELDTTTKNKIQKLEHEVDDTDQKGFQYIIYINFFSFIKSYVEQSKNRMEPSFHCIDWVFKGTNIFHLRWH